MQYEFWDAGVDKPLNLSTRSSGKFLQAIVIFNGHLLGYNANLIASFVNEPEKLRYCNVAYRISLPVGVKEDFEKFTGFILTEAEIIRGSEL